MNTPTTTILVTALAILACAACGANPNKTPPGVAAHRPGSTVGAIANQPQGACHQFTTSQIQTAFGGSVAAPLADNLTPGLDRCNWTISDSTLTSSAMTLAAYQSNLPAPSPTAGLVPVPALGVGATWNASQLTLTWPSNNGSRGLELIAAHSANIDANKALAALTAVVSGH